MAYLSNIRSTGRVQRTRPRRIRRLAGTPLGDDGSGFDWSQFGTQLATSVGTSVATAGTALLANEIKGINQPTVPKTVVQPATAASLISAGTTPSWIWLAGGGFLLLILVMAMKR